MRFSSFVFGFGFVLASTALQGCSSDEGGGSSEPVDCKTTAGVVKKVFQPKCGQSGCHSASDSPDLVSSGFEKKLIGQFSSTCPGQAQVVPGDPEKSYVYRKVTDAKPSCGSPMPFGGAPLSADEIACVRDWIDALPGGGAPTDAGTDTSVASDTGVSDTGSGKTDTGSGPADTGAGPTDTGSGPADTGAGPTDTGTVSDAGAAPTFTQIYTNILSKKCGPCHTASTSGSLDLGTKAKAYTSLVGVSAAGFSCSSTGLKRVVAGDAANSLLAKKVDPSPPCGGRMPTVVALPATEIADLKAWINAGAKND
jgi:hypothetical protein